MPETTTQILKQEITFDGRKLIQGVKKALGVQEKLLKSTQTKYIKLDKATKGVATSLAKYGKAVEKVFKTEEDRMKYMLNHSAKMEELEDALTTATREEADAIHKTREAYTKKYKLATAGASAYAKEVVEIKKAEIELNKKSDEHKQIGVAELLIQKKILAMKEQGLDFDKKALDRVIDHSKEIASAKELLTIRQAMDDLAEREESRKSNKVTAVAGYGGHDMGEDFNDSFKEALGSISSKDMMGMAKGFLTATGSLGKGLAAKGMRAAAKKETGGPMSGMDKVLAKIGPTLGKLAQFAPLLMTVSSSLMAIVKLFLDADSAAKDFNKDILSTAGTTGFLTKNMGNTAAAADDLHSTLTQIYDAATDIKGNWTWGINKEQHAAVINSLTAEGVRLDSLRTGFDNVAKSSDKSAGYVKDWGTMVQMSVGYSRAFGVSLGELSQFQGEMMTEMGASFDTMQMQFQGIAKGAEESGMGANKFFGIIRSVSSDLALYNTRMEDATHLLTLLGKTMNPRNAAKFMQTAAQALKGMSNIDRVKLNIMGGNKMGGRVAEDLKRKSKGTAADIKAAGGKQVKPEDLLDATKDMEDILEGVAKEQQGTFREAIISMRVDKSMAKKGQYGVAAAGKNLGIGASLDTIKDALLRFGGGKSLAEARGNLGTEEIAKNLGLNEEQLDQMVKMEASIDMQRTYLKKLLNKQGKTDKKANEDAKKAREALDKAGIKEADIDSASTTKIMDTLDEGDQKALEAANKQIDYQKETSGFQTSMLSRIDTIMDWLMNKLYHVMVSIWETIVHLWNGLPSYLGGHGGAADPAEMAIKAAKTKDRRLMDALDKSGGDMGKAKGSMVESVGKDLLDNLKASGEEYKKLSETVANEADPKKKEEAQKRMGELVTNKRAAYDKLFGGLNQKQQAGAVSDVGRMDPQMKKIGDIMTQTGVSIEEAMKQSGMGEGVELSEDQVNQLLGKSLWAMTPDQLLDVVPGLALARGTGAPGAPATPPSSAAPAAMSPAVAAAAAPASMKPVTSDDIKTSTETQSGNFQDALDDQARDLRSKSGGIVFNGPYLKSQFGRQMEESVYNAASRALFEYWMYQGTKKDDALRALKAGAGTRDIGALNMQAMMGGASAEDSMGQVLKGQEQKNASTKHADGGLVARPPSGEFFAPVKPGETIMPVGSGGGGGTTKVVIELKGDMLKQIIRATALNTINEHDRAKTSR